MYVVFAIQRWARIIKVSTTSSIGKKYNGCSTDKIRIFLILTHSLLLLSLSLTSLRSAFPFGRVSWPRVTSCPILMKCRIQFLNRVANVSTEPGYLLLDHFQSSVSKGRTSSLLAVILSNIFQERVPMSQNSLSSVSRLTHTNSFHTETFLNLQFISSLLRPIYNPLFASLSC